MNMNQCEESSLSRKTVGPSPPVKVPPHGLGWPWPTFSLTSCHPGVELVVGREPVTVARSESDLSWRGIMYASSLTKRKYVDPSRTTLASIMPRPVPRLTSIHGCGSLKVTKSRVVAYIIRWYDVAMSRPVVLVLG
jgi:hypothetical protein